MAVEIERRFLVADDVDAPDGGTPMRQGYVAEEDSVAVRVRITDDAAVVTIKGGAGLTRTEVEMPVGLDEAEELWALTGGRRIEKVRHRIPLGDVVAELDVFGGALTGLRIVEVEFSSAADADRFVPPDWFGPELTGRSEWSNAALARHGRPD